MKPQVFKSLKDLRTISNNNVNYKGQLKDYQQKGNTYKGKKYMSYQRDMFCQTQNNLYKRALFGLNVFTQDEIKDMNPNKRKRIKKVNLKAQNVLNLYKQVKTNYQLNSFLALYFPNNRIGKFDIIDSSYISKVTLKELNISKKDVIDLFIKEGVLANNFYKIK